MRNLRFVSLNLALKAVSIRRLQGNYSQALRVTQGRIAASGTGIFEVTSPDTTPILDEEEVPEIVFPAGVTGSAVSRADGASIASPTGHAMEIPVGAIDADHLGAYIKESHPSEVGVPEGSRFIVGSYACSNARAYVHTFTLAGGDASLAAYRGHNTRAATAALHRACGSRGANNRPDSSPAFPANYAVSITTTFCCTSPVITGPSCPMKMSISDLTPNSGR